MSSKNDDTRSVVAYPHLVTHSLRAIEPESNQIQTCDSPICANIQIHHNNKPQHLSSHKLATVRHSKLTILGRCSSWFFSPGLASLVRCSNRLRESSRNHTRGQCLWIPDVPYPREVLLPPACDFVSSVSHSSTTRLKARTPVKHAARYAI